MKRGKIKIISILANGAKQERTIIGTVAEAYGQSLRLHGQCLGAHIAFGDGGAPTYQFRKGGTITKVRFEGPHVRIKCGYRTAS